MKYPLPITKLIEVLKKLPGVGNKSAERFAFEMLQWNKSQLQGMASIVMQAADDLHCCDHCGCLNDQSGCHFCIESRQKHRSLCIIASPKDAYTIESTGEFKGCYHVLGGLLSPLDGRGPEFLQTGKLRSRISSTEVEELVIALDSTLEGDATAQYLKNVLSDLPITISRLAFGLPLGSSLDYVDGGTLARAFASRSAY